MRVLILGTSGYDTEVKRRKEICIRLMKPKDTEYQPHYLEFSKRVERNWVKKDLDNAIDEIRKIVKKYFQSNPIIDSDDKIPSFHLCYDGKESLCF